MDTKCSDCGTLGYKPHSPVVYILYLPLSYVLLLRVNSSVTQGNFAWKGRFSKLDPKLSESQRVILGLTSNAVDDGTFWISYDEFRTYFRKVYVSLYRPDWMVNRLSAEWHRSNLTCCFELSVRCQSVEPSSPKSSHRNYQNSIMVHVGLRQQDVRSTSTTQDNAAAGIDIVQIAADGSCLPVHEFCAPHEVYEVRGVCTPTRQNQVSFRMQEGLRYAAFVYCGSKTIRGGSAHPFVFTTHTIQDDIAVLESTDTAQLHPDAMAALAVHSSLSVQQSIGAARVYTLQVRCRLVVAATTESSTTLAWDSEGSSTGPAAPTVFYPPTGDLSGVVDVVPGSVTLIAVLITNEVWDTAQLNVVAI